MNTPFTLRQNLTAVIPLPNAQKLKIDCYAPTGFFTGSFMTADPFSTSPALRRVQFRGMIIHSEGAGLGFFLYRAPATATAVPDPKPGLTVEVSGELSITPADL